MPPKKSQKPSRKPQQKPKDPCDIGKPQQFQAKTIFIPQADPELFRFSKWQLVCFPFVLCCRFMNFCLSVCTGINPFLFYWMCIRWILCKITSLCNCDPCSASYYYYFIWQMIIMSTTFWFFWYYMAKPVLLPYMKALYISFAAATVDYFSFDELKTNATTANTANTSTTIPKTYEIYCFKKSDIILAAPPTLQH